MRTTPRRTLVLTATATVLTASALTAVTAMEASAAAGCRVAYTVTNQWQGGFGASVTITNLGDAINGWTLTWTYSAGQQITQAWNAVVTQTGTQATATNVSYNAALATNATTNFGFNASWTTTNPTPTTFTLNGTTCTGTTTSTTPTSPPASSPPASSAPPSNPPTSSTPASPSASAAATPTTPPAAYPNPGAVSGNTGTHDPTVVKTPAGGYLLAHTGTNIQLKTSTDRITWRDAGAAFPNGASWTTTYTGGSTNLWAPDISHRNGQYYMYYSASSFGSNRSAIFLATSPTGASGTWTNQGLVIETTTSSNYNAIDPNLIVDASGQWWLSLGSFWTGIKLVQLDPSTGKRLDSTVRSIAQRSGSTAIEAPFIFRHGGYYYLWVSFDACCQGASSTYRIMVGRSTSVTGPYVDRNGTAMTSGGGTQVLAGHGSIHGPGHQAVISDTDGEVLFYHYYADSGASYLGINKIGYDTAGWPFVY